MGFIVSISFFLNLCSTDLSTMDCLFKSDFANNKKLNGWTDVHQKNPPNSEWYQIVKDSNGELYLKTREVLFGISHSLKSEIIVDDSLSEVQLLVIFRKPDLPLNGWPVTVALSSSETTAKDAGGPFWKGKDSGLLIIGSLYDKPEYNSINWQKEGVRVRMHPYRLPFNFLEVGMWVEWRLVYRHQEKSLLFFHKQNDTLPFLVQHNVDLSGTVLSSVWIGAWGTEFKEISVYVIKNK